MKTGTRINRNTLSALGMVRTRSPVVKSRVASLLPSGGSMPMNLAEHPRQAQRRHGVFRQWIVVNHVGPRRGRPCEFGQVESLFVFDDVGRLEGLLRGLDGVGGQGGEGIDGESVEFVERVLPAQRAQV